MLKVKFQNYYKFYIEIILNKIKEYNYSEFNF